MGTKVGLWIDHRKALIVAVTDKGEEIRLVISKVEKQPGRSGGMRSTISYEAHQVPADDSRERKFTGHLNIYYNAVIACIRDAESILILGPARSPAAGDEHGDLGAYEEGGREPSGRVSAAAHPDAVLVCLLPHAWGSD